MSRAAAPFPDDFLWGVGTSAFQVEGGATQDGRGPSIWDTFATVPGRIRGGDHALVAADHRNRMREDVGLLAQLGVRAYRFSVSWPRVLPSGGGALSRPGLDFYRELVDELLAHDITPVLTLYHWDLPQPLEDGGGWAVRSTAERFAAYAGVVADALGDRVRHWGTINEPWCASMLGYAAGVHAPGRTEPQAAVAAAHHLLLAHGLGTDAIRAAASDDVAVSITLNPYPVVVAGPTDADRDAARRVDGVANRLWYDALLLGRYPDDVLDDLSRASDLTHVRDGDLAQIARPLDALGLNYYRRHHVRHRAGASASGAAAQWPGSPDVELVTPPGPLTDGGWAIEPDGLREALVEVTRTHRPPPLFVHEAGAAYDDDRDPDGEVRDDARIRWLHSHLDAAREALDEGVDLLGFFVWSFLDNFEWSEGYRHRFGIVHVDYETLERTPKASARWYRQVIEDRGLPGPDPG